MSRPELAGIHHLKLPVADLATSQEWFMQVFGFRPTMEFPDRDGVVRGVAGDVAGLGATQLALREDPDVARGCAGFAPVSFGVDDRDDLQAWAEHLDRLDIAHSPIIEATDGWLLVLAEPGGLEVHLYTWGRHGIDRSARPGRGRTIPRTDPPPLS